MDKAAVAGRAKPAEAASTAAKPVVRGKGKALNAIAAASGRDPAAIVAAAEAARARREEEELAEEEAKRQNEKKDNCILGAKNNNSNGASAAGAENDDDNDEETGQTPSQTYNQLSEQDRYRFECFRRCGFPSLPMEHFIAKMLVDEAEKRCITREGVQGGAEIDSKNYFASSIITTFDVSTTRSEKNNNIRGRDLARSKRKKKHSMKRMLKEESKRRRIAMDQPFPYHRNLNFNGKTSTPPPKLEHLVVPSSASEIVAVVSMLAKCYAQRLVAAARRVANAEMEMEKEKETSETKMPPTEILPLQPHHLLDAHTYRFRAGMDPGFWMSSRIGQQHHQRGGATGGLSNLKGVGVMEAAALGTFDRDRACHLAALAAQNALAREYQDDESTAIGDAVVSCYMKVDKMEE